MELALLQSDVAMESIEEMKEIIKKRLIGLRVENKAAIAPTIEKALKASLVSVIKSEFDSRKLLEKGTVMIIAFVGVNGTGKTTTIARITNWLKENGKSVVLAAAGTFEQEQSNNWNYMQTDWDVNSSSIKQAETLLPLHLMPVEHAKAKHRDIVLIDTAGRMQTNSNLMDEMKKRFRELPNPMT